MSSWIWELAHGHTSSDSTAITTITGQANRNRGRTRLIRPRPLANQITISLSRYMRDSVPTTAMNRLRLRMVGNCPNTVKPMTSITSDGLTLPLEA